LGVVLNNDSNYDAQWEVTSSKINLSSKETQKSLRVIRDGYVSKYTNPRRIETTTAAYHVENQTAHSINNNSEFRYPNSSINPVLALCIQSQKYQRPKNTQQQNA
jgi:hypothetical protein